ncbi:hypothetical protein pb186bvf_006574 [Paramecium bursaria]
MKYKGKQLYSFTKKIKSIFITIIDFQYIIVGSIVQWLVPQALTLKTLVRIQYSKHSSSRIQQIFRLIIFIQAHKKYIFFQLKSLDLLKQSKNSKEEQLVYTQDSYIQQILYFLVKRVINITVNTSDSNPEDLGSIPSEIIIFIFLILLKINTQDKGH